MSEEAKRFLRLMMASHMAFVVLPYQNMIQMIDHVEQLWRQSYSGRLA